MNSMKFYILHVWGDVEPILHGPYKSAPSRDRAAKRRARNSTDDGGFYRLNTDATLVEVEAFTGDELGRED